MFGRHFGNVDMEIADRVALERLLFRLVSGDIGQSGDAVALETAVQGGAREMGKRWLQSVQTVVKRQQGMPAEGNDNRFFLGRQDG